MAAVAGYHAVVCDAFIIVAFLCFGEKDIKKKTRKACLWLPLLKVYTFAFKTRFSRLFLFENRRFRFVCALASISGVLLKRRIFLDNRC